MIISLKCIFLGVQQRKTKDGNTFNILRTLVKPNNESYDFFVTDISKYQSLKEFQEFNLTCNLYKDNKNLLRLSVEG